MTVAEQETYISWYRLFDSDIYILDPATKTCDQMSWWDITEDERIEIRAISRGQL